MQEQRGSAIMPRILMWGTYDLGKPRTRIIRQSFSKAGMEIHEIHFDVWQGVQDKSQINSFFQRMIILLKLLVYYPVLIARYLSSSHHDVVFVGYMGVFDILVLAPFARMRGVPIVWDAFLSVYDTVVNDRRMLRPSSPMARLLLWMERTACRLSTLVVLDTHAHAGLMARVLDLPADRFRAVMVGCEQNFRVKRSRHRPSKRTVLFYGQFIPLHGIETVVQAAQSDRGRDWQWVLIGTGQESTRITDMIERGDGSNIASIPWVHFDDLADHICKADICLGIFGQSEKAASVIPNKVFQVLATGMPLITRDSPAIRELIHDPQPGLYLIVPGNPEALLDALDRFEREGEDLPEQLHDQIIARFLPAKLSRDWRTLVDEAVRLGGKRGHS